MNKKVGKELIGKSIIMQCRDENKKPVVFNVLRLISTQYCHPITGENFYRFVFEVLNNNLFENFIFSDFEIENLLKKGVYKDNLGLEYEFKND